MFARCNARGARLASNWIDGTRQPRFVKPRPKLLAGICCFVTREPDSLRRAFRVERRRCSPQRRAPLVTMHITNIGGSLTTAVCLSLIAWSIRVLRAQKLAELKSRQNTSAGGVVGDGSLPSIKGGRRAYARLSPTAFWLLVQSRSVRPVLIDVRDGETDTGGDGDTMPNGNLDGDEFAISQRLEMAHVPVDVLARTLRNRESVWREKTGRPPPSKRSTIVFISTHGHSASQAAAIATQLGFQRCAVIEGGLAAAAPLAPPIAKANETRTSVGVGKDGDGTHTKDEGGTPGIQNADGGSGNGNSDTNGTYPSNGDADVSSARENSTLENTENETETLGRDALGLLLEYGSNEGGTGDSSVTVIDVRRCDERALYGAVKGSVHLPVEHLPRALLASAADFQKTFHFPKPNADQLVVLYSRLTERAAYAKQLFQDYGAHRVLVLRGGVVSWRNAGGNGEDVRGYGTFAFPKSDAHCFANCPPVLTHTRYERRLTFSFTKTDAYAEGEAPPEPHRVLEPLEIDRQSAQAELMRKNVLLP